MVEALAHPALLPRQVSARGGRELVAGGHRAVAEPERLGAAQEEQEEGGAEEGGEPSAGHHFFPAARLSFPSHCRVFVLERGRAGSRLTSLSGTHKYEAKNKNQLKHLNLNAFLLSI